MATVKKTKAPRRTTRRDGVDWKPLNPREVSSKLSPADLQEGIERATEMQRRTIYVGKVSRADGSALINVTYGPCPVPIVLDDGTVPPVSAQPKTYNVMWCGRPGIEFPPVVDKSLVLMQLRKNGSGMQLWVASTTADVERIIFEVFGVRTKVRAPAEAAAN